MVTLVYEAIRAALIFIPLHEIPEALESFLHHLDRANETARPRQLGRFQEKLELETG